MFVTFDVTRLPFPAPGSGHSAWDLLEMPLRRFFFILDVEIKLKKKTHRKTFLLGSFHQLEDMTRKQTEGSLVIRRVNMITTAKMTGDCPWEMHRIAKMFYACHPNDPDARHHLFQTSEGKRFVDPIYDVQPEDLGNLEEIHDFG